MSSDNLGRTCVIFEDITFKFLKTRLKRQNVYCLPSWFNLESKKVCIPIGIYIPMYVQIAYRYYPEGC